MSYITLARKIYTSLNNTDFTSSLSSNNSFLPSLNYITELSEYKSLKQKYISESDILIKEKLNFYNATSDFLNVFKKNSRVESEMPKNMLFYLFWIWHNDYVMDDQMLESITKPVIPGIMGYMILDLFVDTSNESKEKIYLGLSLIRIAEEMFGKAFSDINTQSIFNKYFAEYSKIQFIELNNLWKECPFSWEESSNLGLKSAPSFSIFEVLFSYVGLSNDKIDDMMNGLLCMTAGAQITDDISDTNIDLANGFETLVMKGFYSKYGTNQQDINRCIDEFLNEEILETIYTNTHALFDKANQLFEKHNDEIFIMYNEYRRYQFNRLFNYSD
jgi:hypothetical protein